MVSELFLVVALSMAVTPFLAEAGQMLAKVFEKSDMAVRAPTSWLQQLGFQPSPAPDGCPGPA